MSFLENILTRLEAAKDIPIIQELRDGQVRQVTGGALLEQVAEAQAFLASKNLQKGDRCALLAHNSIEWVATDLAAMLQGIIVVPLYARQAPAELAAMMKDCSPSLICCGDASLGEAIYRAWSESPPYVTFEQIFACHATAAGGAKLASGDAVSIIYTSGTS